MTIDPPLDVDSMAFVMGKIWNSAVNLLGLEDYSVSIAAVKQKSKKLLMARQCQNDPVEWDKSNFEGFET